MKNLCIGAIITWIKTGLPGESLKAAPGGKGSYGSRNCGFRIRGFGSREVAKPTLKGSVEYVVCAADDYRQGRGIGLSDPEDCSPGCL